jgi:hypothetical protein
VREHATRAELAADRILSWPKAPRKSLVHDRDLRRIRVVGLGEIAPRDQRQAQRAEIPRRDDGEGVGCVLPNRALVAVHAHVPALAAGEPQGEPAGERGVLDAGQRGEAVLGLPVERPAGRHVVAVHANLHSGDQHVIRIEAEVDLAGLAQALDAQSRPDKQRERDGDLRHHEPVAQPVLRCASLRGQPPSLLQDGLQVEVGGLKRGDQPEGDPGRHRKQQREAQRQGAQVEVELRVRGDLRRQEEGDRVHSPGREKRSRASAKERQNEALGQEQADQLPAPRAGGNADRNLLLAAGRPGQQEVADVRGHDQLHAEADRKEQAKRGAHRGLASPGAPREGHHAVVRLQVVVGICLGQLRIHRGHGRLRLLDAHAGLQPGEIKPSAGAARRQKIGALVPDLPDHGRAAPTHQRSSG